MPPEISSDRLSCGIPVCIQTSNESQLLSIAVWIRAGSVVDPAGKGGLAHLCEHLLLRPLACSSSRAHMLQQKTGGLVNAHTDAEWIVISAEAPLKQSELLIELLSALLRDPYCEPSGFIAEKEVVLQELQDEGYGSAELLTKTFRESAFPDNPFVRPVGGTSESLAAIVISDIQEYYARFLNRSRLLITAHGGCDFGDLAAKLDLAFKDLPERSVSSDSTENESTTEAHFIPEYRPVTIHRRLSDRRSGPGSGYGLLAGIGSVPRRSDDYWTALAFEVLMADGPGSLLNIWLRDERPWIYGMASMTEAFSNWGSQYFIMHISRDPVEEVVHYLGEKWRSLPESVTAERMEGLRNRLESRALSSIADLQDRMTLMRDIALSENRELGTLEGGLEALVTRHARDLNSGNLRSYIQGHAEWGRVSLVCAPS